MTVVTTRVPVDVTATLISATAAWGSRLSRAIYNNGPQTIWIGGDQGVTTANGFPIVSGGAIVLDQDAADEIWGICSVLQVAPANTCLLTESKA